MLARIRTRLRQAPGTWGLLALILVALAVVFVGVPWWQTGDVPDWTGFGRVTTTVPSIGGGQVVNTRTLWDWLQLVVVPVSAALLVYWLNRRDQLRNAQQHIADLEREERQHIADVEREERQHKEDLEREERQHEADRAREDARLRQAALEAYLDRMGALLLNSPLRARYSDANVRAARDLARARTLAVLPQLDAIQKRAVVEFLYGADLIMRERALIDLNGADLVGADLSYISLSRASLRLANLSKANLFHAYLDEADLVGTNLRGADLRKADLHDAYLPGAILRGTALNGANLCEAGLYGINLREADLREADLREADLSEFTILVEDVIVHGAWANLTGALVTPEQLMAVRSLEGATLPNGAKYTGPPQPTNEADLGPRDPDDPDYLAQAPMEPEEGTELSTDWEAD